jgi:hypothetical protein
MPKRLKVDAGSIIHIVSLENQHTTMYYGAVMYSCVKGT